MYWVVQEDLYAEEGHRALLHVLDRMDLPHSTHRIVPGVRRLDPEPCIPVGTQVIVLGAYTMLAIAQERAWLPGAYLLGNHADLSVQREHWGDRLLNVDAWVGRLADVPPFDRPSFVRPILDSKVFNGKVFAWHDFVGWREGLPGDTRVLVAPRKTIYAEYRTWVVGGRVVTASQYRMGSAVLYDEKVPPDVIDFAQRAVDRWDPTPAYVLDVALIQAGLRIIEVNTINAAGWYKGNVGQIVAALEDLSGA